MSRLLPRLVLAALALTYGLTAQAANPAYRALLNGTSESPENGSPAIGNAQVVHDVSDHTLKINAVFRGLMSKTSGARIDGPNGTPITRVLPGFPQGVKSGSYNKELDLTQKSIYDPAFLAANGGSVSRAEKALAAQLAAGTAFFNLMSTGMPGGEIRGLLQPFDPTPVSGASWTRVKSLYR